MPKRKMRVKEKGWTVLLLLALLVTPALAHAKMFGDWGLDMANDGAVVFVRNAGFVNEGSVAFICSKKPRGISVSITPPKELYANAQETVKVVIVHGDNDSLVQEWRNGYRYIFQNNPDTVKELVTCSIGRPRDTSATCAAGQESTTPALVGPQTSWRALKPKVRM